MSTVSLCAGQDEATEMYLVWLEMCDLYLAKDRSKPSSDSFLNHTNLVPEHSNGKAFPLKC